MTHVKVIVPAHLPLQLTLNPRPYPRSLFPIQPRPPLHLSHDPLFPTLLRQHISQPSIITRPPKHGVNQEKDLGRVFREYGEENELDGEEGEVEHVEVRFWVRWVKEGC